MDKPKRPQPPTDVNVNLPCTLRDLYNGCLKKVNYFRTVLHPNGRSVAHKQESIEVEIKPGYSHGQVLTYAKQGNE